MDTEKFKIGTGNRKKGFNPNTDPQQFYYNKRDDDQSQNNFINNMENLSDKFTGMTIKPPVNTNQSEFVPVSKNFEQTYHRQGQGQGQNYNPDSNSYQKQNNYQSNVQAPYQTYDERQHEHDQNVNENNNNYYHQMKPKEEPQQEMKQTTPQQNINQNNNQNNNDQNEQPEQENVMSEEEYITMMNNYVADLQQQNPNAPKAYEHTREEYDGYLNYMKMQNPNVYN